MFHVKDFLRIYMGSAQADNKKVQYMSMQRQSTQRKKGYRGADHKNNTAYLAQGLISQWAYVRGRPILRQIPTDMQ